MRKRRVSADSTNHGQFQDYAAVCCVLTGWTSAAAAGDGWPPL